MDVRTLCLGALFLAPATGHEVRKRFGQGPSGHVLDADVPSIHPALKGLERQGAIATTTGGGEERSRGGDARDRVADRITATGRAAPLSVLLAPRGPDRARSDTLFVAFSRQSLPADHLNRVNVGRQAWLRASGDHDLRVAE